MKALAMEEEERKSNMDEFEKLGFFDEDMIKMKTTILTGNHQRKARAVSDA